MASGLLEADPFVILSDTCLTSSIRGSNSAAAQPTKRIRVDHICMWSAGLDARAAAIVMQSVKNVSKNGRTVVVTIHQPSIDIFETFDALVLLQRGGKVGPLPF